MMQERDVYPHSGTISNRLRSGEIAVDPMTSPRADEALATDTYPHDGIQIGTGWYSVYWVPTSYQRRT